LKEVKLQAIAKAIIENYDKEVILSKIKQTKGDERNESKF
jgi:hypothetical protein